METIDDFLCSNCSKLEEIYIPESVTTMPDVMLFDAKTCPKAVIVTPKGSTAEKHAIEFDLPYRNE